MTEQQSSKSLLERTFYGNSLLLFIFAMVMAAFAYLALNHRVFILANTAIWLTNIYLLMVLVFSAVRSDGLEADADYKPCQFIKWFFPTRLIGLALFVLFAYTLITAFAALYLQLATVAHFSQEICNVKDAIYFSFVTITTLGYGEFHPVSDVAKELVVLQLGSGLLLLFGAFPLLISRISTFTANR